MKIFLKFRKKAKMNSSDKPSRISMKSIFESVLVVFNFEKGLSFTIKNLLLKPGKTLRDYLFTAERSKHIKPMNFLLLMITIGTFLTIELLKKSNPEVVTGGEYNDFISGSSINLGDNEKINQAIGLLNRFISQYYHLFQLLKIPFFALATFWLYRKHKYNYAEHLIISSYIVGLTTFLFIVAFPAMLLSVDVFAFLIAGSIFYMFFAFILVFEEKNIKGFLKAIASYLLATVMHLFLVAIVVGGIYLSL